MSYFIVFLDIDGVLITDSTYALPGNKAEISEMGGACFARPDRLVLESIRVFCLNEMVHFVPELRFVLSSSWRHSVGTEAAIRMLERNGLPRHLWHADPACPWSPPTPEGRALGATTRSSKSDDIRAWLSAHAQDVKMWLALDDDKDLALKLLGIPIPGGVIPIDADKGFLPDAMSHVLLAFSGALWPKAELG